MVARLLQRVTLAGGLVLAGLASYLVATPVHADPATAQITGTVTDEFLLPLSGIQASAYVWDATNGWWNYAAAGFTDSNGSYAVGGLSAGTYRVCFFDFSTDYVSECYDDADYNFYSVTATATDIAVSAGGTTSGIDAQLAFAGHITGTVTDASGAALSAIEAEAQVFDVVGGYWSTEGWGYTQSDGTYEIGGLPAGTYRVCFWDWNTGTYLGECYDDAGADVNNATDIAVIAGGTTTGIDAQLDLAAHIAGTVSDSSGAVLAGVSVRAHVWDTSNSYWRNVRSATTDANGAYDIGGLSAGTYRVCFFDWNTGDYLNECYDDAGADVNNATDIAVIAGGTTTGIDAQLDLAAHIAGTVSDSSGAVVAGVSVRAHVWDTSNSYWRNVRSATTDANGAYDIGGLSAGTYRQLRVERRRDPRLLGKQRLWPVHAPRRRLRPGQRGQLSHLRADRQRDPRLLGKQRLWPGHAARWHVQPGERGRLSHLCGQHRRNPRLLGIQCLWPGHAPCRNL